MSSAGKSSAVSSRRYARRRIDVLDRRPPPSRSRSRRSKTGRIIRSIGTASPRDATIARKIRINVETTPILEWQWKLTQLPAGADLRQRPTSDAAPHVFVVWPRTPALLRSQLIGYIWDATLPVGTVQQSQKTRTVRFIIVRSGTSQLGRWQTERRNVADDFRLVYGAEPDAPGAVALSIDTNDTQSSSEGFVGPLLFRSRVGLR